MSPATPTDWAILAFLSAHPQPIRDLLDRYPKATVYARLRALQAKGLVAKRGREYLLTTAGLQAKAQRQGAPALEGLNGVYAPLRVVPSPQHRALVELAISALVLRQLTDQEEHHAGFLLLGPPLTWKTAGGRFLCLVAGADPEACVVDLAAESGRSLWVRRGAAGDIRSQRQLLSAPIIVLDEYGQADRAVRQTVAPFISGRRRLPFENETLAITPVPIICMNPRPGESLSARTGFSPAQLRRLVPCDLGAVSLPDLALEGGRAIDAARDAGPLALRPPRGSCEEFRSPAVKLLRQVLVPEAVGLVDVELLIGLGRGLTGWLTPVVAMQQALYDFLLVVETVGWVRPGWLEAVRAFPDGGEGAAVPVATPGPVGQLPASARSAQTISLFPERTTLTRQKEHPMNSRESMLPAFAISDHTKGLLAWMAVDAGASLDRVVEILVDLYRMQRQDDTTFQDLVAVVRLREACEAAEISVTDLRIAVELNVGLHERGLGVLDNIPTTLRVADDLAEAGLSLKDAVAVASLMKAMKKAGVDPRMPEQLQGALERYGALGYEPRRITQLAECWTRLTGLGLGLDDLEAALARLGCLTELGLDGNMAEALAATLDLAGVPEAQRGAVLTKAVRLGQAGMALAEAQADREALQEEIRQLRDEQGALEEALTAGRDELARIQQEEAEWAALAEQATLLRNAISAGVALQSFLLGDLDAADDFYDKVAVIRETRRKGSPQFPGLETWLTAQIQERVREFLTQISTRPLPPAPGPQGTSTKG